MATTKAPAFDPSAHLTNLKGSDYLEVKWRLVWLRTEHPDAVIETDCVSFNDTHAVFKATVNLANGAKATGWGSEERKDFKDYIEKAETKAIGRALGALGFGTQFADDFADADSGRIADAPVQRQNAPQRDEEREKAMKSVFALGAARGLNQDQVKQLAYKRGGTDSMTKLTVQALRLLWKHMDGSTPDALKAELAQEGAQY